MAEPEELEEDLFADLYDADESTNRATSAVETAKPAEPAASAIPAEPTGDAPIQSYEDSHVDTYPAQAPPQMEYGMGYQNGHDGASATPIPAPADNDNHGTGIKEDGSATTSSASCQNSLGATNDSTSHWQPAPTAMKIKQKQKTQQMSRGNPWLRAGGRVGHEQV